MFPSIPYVSSRGEPSVDATHDVYLYGLSFCDHCQAARGLLEQLGISFAMTYLDQLEPDVRRPVLATFRELYGKSVIYPVIEIDGVFTFGFDRDTWLRLLRPDSQNR
jgi:glutaredoxin